MLLQVYGLFCTYWHADVIGEKAMLQFKVCKIIARQGGVCMPWMAPEEGKPMVAPGFGPHYSFGDESFQVNALTRATLCSLRPPLPLSCRKARLDGPAACRHKVRPAASSCEQVG